MDYISVSYLIMILSLSITVNDGSDWGGRAVLLQAIYFFSSGEARTRYDECILFKSNQSFAMQKSESYLELGFYSILKNRNWELSFTVLPDPDCHNGPLFAIGTEGFKFYEWKTKAVIQQFVVIEFFYSSISLVVKPLGEAYMTQIEIYKHPTPYYIDDAAWHTVKVKRIISDDGKNQSWFIQLDDLTREVVIQNETNVDMYDCKAFIGGRPGYKSYQFRGIIRNLMISGERTPLSGLATYGLTEVWHCTAPEVESFQKEILSKAIPDKRRFGGKGGP